MTKHDLIKRWKTKEGAARLANVIDCLTKGKSFSSVPGIGEYEGRWDLRGAQLSKLESKRRVESGGHGLTQKFGSLKLKDASIESIDFSYADISYSLWAESLISNCLFEETIAKEIRVYASDFYYCIFRRANLYYSYLNENVGTKAGSFNKVEFIDTNLSECIFSFPIMENCLFEDCNLVATNFDGARMKNCRFKGIVDSPWFRGYSTTARRSVLGIFNRVEPKEFANRMDGVDFSDAELLGVSFSHGIDLAKCIFPNDASKYLVLSNLKSVYKEARALIEKAWIGEDKRKGLGFIDTILFKPDHHYQPMDLIDKNLLTDSGKDHEFGNKLFDLLYTINLKLEQRGLVDES